MRIHRTAARSAGIIALLAPLTLGFTATQALAATSDFTNPSSDGATISSSTISANVPGCTATLTRSCKSTTLSLSGPGGASASGSAANQSGTHGISATVPTSAANGRWTATLAGGDTGSITFYTDFAPATPSGFAARSEDGDSNEVFLDWSANTEPDVVGYRLTDGQGKLTDLVANDVCSGTSSCHYTVYNAAPAAGTSKTYSYTLSALRSGGCPSAPCANVVSEPTSSRTATLSTPAPPAPTPGPSASGGTTTGGSTGATTGGGTSTTGGTSTGGSTGATTTGGTSAATTGGTKASAVPTPTLPNLDPIALQRRALALNFQAFSPGLGIPKLPPLPDTSAPQLAGDEGAIPSGTYNPQLPYQAGTKTTKTTSIIADPIGSIKSIDLDQLAKSLAVAMILILSAAHLRRWIGVHVED